MGRISRRHRSGTRKQLEVREGGKLLSPWNAIASGKAHQQHLDERECLDQTEQGSFKLDGYLRTSGRHRSAGVGGCRGSGPVVRVEKYLSAIPRQRTAYGDHP